MIRDCTGVFVGVKNSKKNTSEFLTFTCLVLFRVCSKHFWPFQDRLQRVLVLICSCSFRFSLDYISFIERTTAKPETTKRASRVASRPKDRTDSASSLKNAEDTT